MEEIIIPTLRPALVRAKAFCETLDIRIPILLAPMAGACPTSLSIAVANAGGLGACGALLMQSAAIKIWASQVRASSNGGFQLNLWLPDPAPARDAAAEEALRAFLAQWGPEVARDAGETRPPDFATQCDAMLDVGPAVVSSIMGVWTHVRPPGLRLACAVPPQTYPCGDARTLAAKPSRLQWNIPLRDEWMFEALPSGSDKLLQADGKLSRLARSRGLSSFAEVVRRVQRLPYGRNSNRADYRLVLAEMRGTCSTKPRSLPRSLRRTNWRSISCAQSTK